MPPSPQSAGVLSFERAQEFIQQHSRKLKATRSESVAIEHALNRVLAEPVLADRDFPPFRRATRDGYAVKAADLSTIPATLGVMGQVRAGSNYQGIIQSRQAVEIMTGAPVPEGADAVVMVEYTQPNGQQVEILRGVTLVKTSSRRAVKERLARKCSLR